ncbi:MAG TPA: chemotaxis protein CheB [Vicinamibacteria bacterium]|jgi:two-component system chemotaxis response regulator CheB
MPGQDIIVVGASAGGVEALKQIVAQLPPDLPAAIFAAIHVAPSGPRLLPAILNASGRLCSEYATDEERIRPGRLYLAPPDHHLLVGREVMRLTRGPRENGHRPAVDPLFRSAAVAHGPRVIGVVLTGNLDDGTRGLRAVKRCGGISVVQDPENALYPSMPASALQNTPVDHCVPLARLPALLAELAGSPAGPPLRVPTMVEAESSMDARQEDEEDLLDRIGTRSSLTCPECHGALWELKDGNLVNFRCHVGHAFSPDALFGGHSEDLEAALWAAVRGFEESAMIAERIAERGRASGEDTQGQRFAARAQAARQHAQKLRQLIDTLPVMAE